MIPRLAPTVAALALACLFVAPAVAADRDTVRKQLEASVPKWQAAKKACDGNYEYTVRFSSWVGFGHETTIVVRGNKIVERRYRSWAAPDRGPVPPGGEKKKPEGESWTEKGDELGSHKQGAPLKTLDDLYADAAKALAADRDPANTRYYFRADKAGVMLSCFWQDSRIADDAPTHGPSIATLKLIVPEQG